MASSNDLHLLSRWASPYVMRVQLALFVKGITFTNSEQDLFNKGPLLLQYNPIYKKVPVLLHNGKPLCESLVIVQYLDEAFPSADGHDLLPKDPYDRAIARFWVDFIQKKIVDILYHSIFKLTGDERKASLNEAKENFAVLEEAIGTVPKEPPFFGGAKPGYVDVVLGPFLAWEEAFEAAGNFKLEFEKLPRLAAWKKAMLETPAGQQLPAQSRVRDDFLKRLHAWGMPIDNPNWQIAL